VLAVLLVLIPVADEDSTLPLSALLRLKPGGPPPSRSRLRKLPAFRAAEPLLLTFLLRLDLPLVMLTSSRSIFQPSLRPRRDSVEAIRVRLTDLVRPRFCRPPLLPRPADLERPPVD